jgi:hypothetical protein
VALVVLFDVVWLHVNNASLIHFSWRDQVLRNQPSQPFGGERLELVVVRTWQLRPLPMLNRRQHHAPPVIRIPASAVREDHAEDAQGERQRCAEAECEPA